MNTNIKLRPHHLLCISTYIGEGYSASFIANYDAVIRQLKQKFAISIVAGPDDICQPMLSVKKAHCVQNGIVLRDKLAAQSLNKLWAQSVIEPGKVFYLDKIKLKTIRSAFQKNQIREACLGCEWSSLCTQVANENFDQVKLKL